jgi:hypothetical protein
MGTIRKPRSTVYTVTISPNAHAKIAAISHSSKRPIPELLDMAINLFATATRHLNTMHQPPNTDKPLTAEQRAQRLASPRPTSSGPHSIARIMQTAATTERKRTR